jgi:carbamoyl-phosphate synthase large subunit
MLNARAHDLSDGPRCVLIPGAGGAAGIGAIKALRLAGYRGRIVATDADPLAPGLELADVGTVVPPAATPGFFEHALHIIRREGVEAILPTSGFDTPVYAAHEGDLHAEGVVVIGCGLYAMQTCLDKWRFYERVRDEFPVPATHLTPPEDLGFPCFVKPRMGKGGRGAALCRDRAELALRLRGADDLLVQAYLPGAEYSVDVLADLDGRPLVAVPRLHLMVQERQSVRGQVLHDETIERLCLGLAAALHVKGPVSMQLKCDASGVANLLEVNPRMGGSTYFAALAGVNMAALCLDLAARRPLPALSFSEITVARYFEELVLIGEDRRRPARRFAAPTSRPFRRTPGRSRRRNRV